MFPKDKIGGKWVFPVPLFPMTCKFAFKTSKSPNKLFGDEYALCPQKTKSGENEYSRSPYSQWHVNLHSKIQSPPIIYLGTNMRYVLKRQNRGEFMFFSLNEYSPYSQWHVILHSKLQSPPTNYLGTNMLYVPKRQNRGKWVFPVPLFPMTCKFAFKTSKSPNKLFGDEYALCSQKTKSGGNEYSRSPYSQWHVNLHSKIQSPPIIYLGTKYALCPQKTKSGEITLHVFSLNEYSPYSQWHVILHSKLQNPPINYLGTNMLYVPKRQNRGEMSIPGPPTPNDM